MFWQIAGATPEKLWTKIFQVGWFRPLLISPIEIQAGPSAILFKFIRLSAPSLKGQQLKTGMDHGDSRSYYIDLHRLHCRCTLHVCRDDISIYMHGYIIYIDAVEQIGKPLLFWARNATTCMKRQVCKSELSSCRLWIPRNPNCKSKALLFPPCPPPHTQIAQEADWWFRAGVPMQNGHRASTIDPKAETVIGKERPVAHYCWYINAKHFLN